MRISVPSLPQTVLSFKPTAPPVSPQEATRHLSEFIRGGNVTLITGAGVSVDSGIRAYRGQDGRYMNPNYKPILYNEFIDEGEKGHLFRQRYWLRSYLGYPPVRDTQPNTTHYALAALQYTNHIPRIITQNVDGLHHKALRAIGTRDKFNRAILELHGSLHRVVCQFGHVIDRETFQEWLSAANPKWKAFAHEIERTGAGLRTNPDGDVAVEHLSLAYETFLVPNCPRCLTENHKDVFLKPEFVFFGESIPEATKIRSYQDIEASGRVLLMGTTLATHSSFRLAKHALELKRPVMMLNVGPTRADCLPGVTKIELPTSLIMRDVVRGVLGPKLVAEPVIHDLLLSGMDKLPPPDSKATGNPKPPSEN